MIKSSCKYSLVLLFVFAVSFLAYAESPTTYYSSVLYEPNSLDPIDVRNPYASLIASQIIEGLVSLDNNMNIVPGLAKKWTISKDGKKLAFYLRKGALFSNGKEVDSNDVYYSMKRLVKKEKKNLFFRSFNNIVGVKSYLEKETNEISGFSMPDKHTFEIYLTKPNPSFYKILAAVNCGIVSANINNDIASAKYPVSIGPFYISKWVPGSKIILKPNKYYYGIKPKINELVFYILSEEETLSYFKSNKIYDTFSLSWYKDINLPSSKIHHKISTVLPMLFFISINSRKPPLDNIYFRKALITGLDKKTLLENVFSNEMETSSHIPYGIGGYSSSHQHNYSPKKALEYLQRSNLDNKLLERKMILWGRDTIPNKTKFKDIIESNYRNIGLNIEVKFISVTELLNRYYKENDFDMFYGAHNINLNDAMFVLAWYESTTNNSIGGLNNAKYDLIMDLAREEPDDFLKSKLYMKADSILHSENIQINLFNRIFNGYINNKVQNFKISKIGPSVRFNEVILKTENEN